MRKILAATVFAAMLGSLAAQAAADLSGVWRIAGDHGALLTLNGKPPPLLPAARQAYLATKARRAAGDLSWDPTATQCKPPSEPRIMLEPMPFEIVQRPDRIFIAYQWNGLDRFINLNQPLKVLLPTYFGTSAAKWQGNTLVVEVAGFNAQSFLDRDGLPHSSALKLIERFSLSPDRNTLIERITVNDPASFSAPWTAELRFNRQSGRLGEDICEQREGLVKQ